MMAIGICAGHRVPVSEPVRLERAWLKLGRMILFKHRWLRDNVIRFICGVTAANVEAETERTEPVVVLGDIRHFDPAHHHRPQHPVRSPRYLPNGTYVKSVNGGTGGKPPFRDHLDYLDK